MARIYWPQSKTRLADKKRDTSLRKSFSRTELYYYGSGALVYIILGILLLDLVLNWIVGPLFIVAWMWLVPSLIGKLKGNSR